jgi:hypothetical protein
MVMIRTMTSNTLENGYLWFFCLLTINIIIVVFITWFYYYKINQPGNTGNIGENGFPGIDGDICTMTIPCYSQIHS